MWASLISKRTCQLVVGLVLGVLTVACRENNPAYVGKNPGHDSSVGGDVPLADVAPEVAPGPDAAGAPDLRDDGRADSADEGHPDRSRDGVPDESADTSSDGKIEPDLPGGQDDAADAPPALPDSGDGGSLPPPDGRDGRGESDTRSRDVGTESSPPLDGLNAETRDGRADGSADASGGNDGFVALDAQDDVADSSPPCHEGDTRDVISPSNPLLGACHAGKDVCTNGAWVQVTAEVTPAGQDSCTGVDDNCNGMVDDGCTSTCVVVSPDGDDNDGDGSAESPFATIGRGIGAVGSADGGSGMRVCVAGGKTCSDSASYEMAERLAMVDGIAVQGNYALDSGALKYCGASSLPTTTILFKTTNQGVVFGDGIVSRTELSGFSISRHGDDSGDAGATAGPIAGVVVNGGKNVALSRIFVTDAPNGATTYGVSISGGGQALIVASSIGGGAGRTAAVGVLVDGGSVELRNNCDSVVGGYCKSGCSDARTSSLGIQGRYSNAQPGTGVESSAVFVTNAASPAILIANTLCGGPSDLLDSAASGASVAALRCGSGGCGTVTANAISGGNGRVSVGVALAGQGAVLDSNQIESGCGDSTSTCVLLETSSARLVNNLMLGSTCSGSGSGGSTQPVFRGLDLVLGASTSASVAEADVSSNDIEPLLQARQAQGGPASDCSSIGVLVERTGAVDVTGGALRNNIISAGACPNRTGVSESVGAALRLFEYNDLYSPAGGSAGTLVVLYHSEADGDLTSTVISATSTNISADPGYVSSSTGDLHLTLGSACVDRGTAASTPAYDADGTLRPQGSGFDIGAYELKP